jgi:hypothetical protein
MDPTGKSADEDLFDLMYGIQISGNWTSENKSVVRTAVKDVANRFLNTLGAAGLPINNPQAGIFKAVYGIRKNDIMKFTWDTKCKGCRPDLCVAKNNVGGKKGLGKDYWEDDVVIPLKDGKVAECDCKPTGGVTYSSRWIEFATIWSDSYSNVIERRVNNVVHELGHAFNSRTGGISAILVNNTHVPIDGEEWRLVEKPLGFYDTQDGEMTWMQSQVETGSETFADMFLGWVYTKWAADDYGDARARFMNEHMLQWIRQAMRKH